MTVMPFEGVAVALGIVFALAAAPKVRHPRRFAQAVEDYGLVPAPLAPVTAAGLVIAESMLAAGHLSGLAVPAVAALGLVVATGMLAASAVLVWRGIEVPCFCFDAAGLERTSSRTVVRAGMVVAGEGTLLASGLGTFTLAPDALLAALLLLGCAGWVTSWPEARQALRGHIPRVHFSVSDLEDEP